MHGWKQNKQELMVKAGERQYAFPLQVRRVLEEKMERAQALPKKKKRFRNLPLFLIALPGVVYLIINNSLTESTTVELPKDADRYTLAGENGNVRAAVMTLNGKPLVL